MEPEELLSVFRTIESRGLDSATAPELHSMVADRASYRDVSKALEEMVQAGSVRVIHHEPRSVYERVLGDWEQSHRSMRVPSGTDPWFLHIMVDERSLGNHTCVICGGGFHGYVDRANHVCSKPECGKLAALSPISGSVEKVLESIYEHADETLTENVCSPIIVDLRAEIVSYLDRHPNLLYSISPRRFEELVADILEHMGFDVDLTKATRDGGVDIYAYFRRTVATFLMVVECKRQAPDNPVGIDVVQRINGVQNARRANKAMIVTTSYFSGPAKTEASNYGHLMDLRDYLDLKSWLKQYPEIGRLEIRDHQKDG